MDDEFGAVSHISLSKALAAFGTDDFEITLLYDLEMQCDNLPTHLFCEYGGLPDTPKFELKTWSDDEGAIYLIVAVEFDEVVPTSCYDHPQTYSRSGELDITIDKTNGDTSVTIVD